MNQGLILETAGLAIMVTGIFRYGWRLTLTDVIGDVMVSAGNFLQRSWFFTVFFGAAAIIIALTLWRRRKRKRALRQLGAKSRAAIAALVRRAREAAAPRPVLRPVPGGAR